MLKCILTSHSASVRISFGQIKLNQSFLVSHISSLYVHRRQRSFQRKEQHPHCETWRRLSYARGLLHCIWHKVALNLCKAQWNQKILCAFCREMYCPVSESLVSITANGSFDWKTTQNIHLKSPRVDGKKTLGRCEEATVSPGLSKSRNLQPGEGTHQNLRELEQFAPGTNYKLRSVYVS